MFEQADALPTDYLTRNRVGRATSTNSRSETGMIFEDVAGGTPGAEGMS